MTTACLQDQLRMCKAQLDQSEKEKGRITEQMKELIRMNTHWQRYDSQRDDYLSKIEKDMQDLLEKLWTLRQRVNEPKANSLQAHQKLSACSQTDIQEETIEDFKRQRDEMAKQNENLQERLFKAEVAQMESNERVSI